jgi:hypothetical protein
MHKFVSKIQYVGFEPGEFVDEKERKYEDVIAIIEQMPWTKEKAQPFADMTTTSVTIENNVEYLKLALYFENKFVLYFFTNKKKLYSKSFNKIKDSYPFIRQFYENIPFDITEFTEEVTFLKEVSSHFKSIDSRYKIDKERVQTFLLQNCWMQFVFSFIIIVFCIVNPEKINFLILFFLLLVCFLVGGGLNIILFLNYYKNCKNFMLVMSKGDDIFYFGDKDNLIQFNKNDIDKVVTYKTRFIFGRASIFTGYEVVQITFKTGKIIEIPSLFLDSDMIIMKLKNVVSQTQYVLYPSMNTAIS